MVYSYDRNIQMPTKDLYDTQIMAMALNVAKDEYEKAEKRLDDLNKLYGDFYSPSDADMKNWQTYVVDPIKNQLDDLYASGIDPTRSAEGKAILARTSRNLPYDKINQLKQSAAVMQENIKNAAELQARNLYDPEYAKFLKQYPKTWDTINQGVFSYASPTALPTWHDTVSPYYDKRTAMPLTQEEMAAEGYQFDPMKNYTGYIQKHIEQVADANLPAYLRTPEGQYRQYQAKQQLAALSGRSPEEVSDAEANAEVKRSWMGAGQEWLIGPEGELDPRKFDDYRTQNDIKAYRQKAAIDHHYKTLESQNPNPTKSSKNIKGGYKGDMENPLYDHLTTLTNNATDFVQEQYFNGAQRGVAVGINVDGSKKLTDILADPTTGIGIAVVEDARGNIDGAQYGQPGKKYRLLDEKEQQAYIVNTANNPYESLRVKDQFGTTFDYFKSNINSSESFPDAQLIQDDVYTIDGVMDRVYGNNATYKSKLKVSEIDIPGEGKRGKSRTVRLQDCIYEPTGYGCSPIMEDSRGNKKQQFEEVAIYEKDKNGQKIGDPIMTGLIQIGEYKQDEEGYWVPTPKWYSRMFPGNVNVTKETGVNESPFLKNKR